MLASLWLAFWRPDHWCWPSRPASRSACPLAIAARAPSPARSTEAARPPCDCPLYLASTVATLAPPSSGSCSCRSRRFMTSPGRARMLHLDYLLDPQCAAMPWSPCYLAAAALCGVAVLLRRACGRRSPCWRVRDAGGRLSLYAYVLPFGYPQMNGTDVRAGPGCRRSRPGCSGSRADAARDRRRWPPALTCLLQSLRWPAPRLVGDAPGQRLPRRSRRETGVSRRRPRRRRGRPGDEHEQQPGSAACGSHQAGRDTLLPLPGQVHGQLRRVHPRGRSPSLADRLRRIHLVPAHRGRRRKLDRRSANAMLGGYDYTPVEMNARHQSLLDLSVEAFSILPLQLLSGGLQECNVVNPGRPGLHDGGRLQLPCPWRGDLYPHTPVCGPRPGQSQNGISTAARSPQVPATRTSSSSWLRCAPPPYLMKEAIHLKGSRGAVPGTIPPARRSGSGRQLELPESLHVSPVLRESNLNIVSSILPPRALLSWARTVQPRQEILWVPPMGRWSQKSSSTSVFALQHAIAARCALLDDCGYLDHLKSAVGVYENTQDRGSSPITELSATSGSPPRARCRRAAAPDPTLAAHTRSCWSKELERQEAPLQDFGIAFMPNAEVPRIVSEEDRRLRESLPRGPPHRCPRSRRSVLRLDCSLAVQPSAPRRLRHPGATGPERQGPLPTLRTGRSSSRRQARAGGSPGSIPAPARAGN